MHAGDSKSTAAFKYQLRANIGVKHGDISSARNGFAFKNKGNELDVCLSATLTSYHSQLMFGWLCMWSPDMFSQCSFPVRLIMVVRDVGEAAGCSSELDSFGPEHNKRFLTQKSCVQSSTLDTFLLFNL